MDEVLDDVIPPGKDAFRGLPFEAATELYETFVTSSVQKLAFDTIRDDILHADLWWVAATKHKTIRKKIEITHWQYALWRSFIDDILLQLCLYGFAVYRLTKVKVDKKIPNVDRIRSPRDLEAADTADTAGGTAGDIADVDHRTESCDRADAAEPEAGAADDDDDLYKWHPEVAQGDCISLEWSTAFMKWIPISIAGGTFDASKGWKILFESLPYRVGPNNIPLLSSVAATAYSDVKVLKTLLANLVKRDTINTSAQRVDHRRQTFWTSPAVLFKTHVRTFDAQRHDHRPTTHRHGL